jgi:P22 coat protein - gene protein 5
MPFSKEERVAFEDQLAAFNDLMVESRTVSIYGTDGQLMERASDTIWRPVPYIMNSQTRVIGTPVLPQIVNQLSVPSRLNIPRNVTWSMTALELRDALQENRLGEGAKTRIASDINGSVRSVAANQGTLIVPITGAPGTYDHIALAQAVMDEQGVPAEDRYLFLAPREANGIAGNLVNVNRSFGNSKSDNAFERSKIGDNIASFDVMRSDGAVRLGGVNPTVTMNTTGANVKFVPRTTDANGNNVDNRTQQVTVSSTTGVTAGSMIAVAGIESVHQITKQATGQLKTARVISVDSPTTMTISPPLIGATGAATDVERQYKNVEVVSTSATATVTFLNRNTANVNPFWHKDSIQMLPGRYVVPDGAGVDVMRGTTDQGLELVMTKRFDPERFTTLFTFDTFFGVVNLAPEMNGAIIWGQP